ncbi:eukaryotic translation initiation factor 2D isoform X2 [Phascolarctos cinereus]|uniref:Eukaryotic translation initiation factor 2D isoform X2 n=1 Tax=Phascolarctos cinereus TaxID=38626 RepID=A0A6P5LRF6_PHACI|nr:eukaryotic translation initiation factor 2D isoform X2 [Phascolarctos cinereus]XP_020858601.1 eukaryotic translation initiation factor 2D isoform X2 [Phascolarctos cinereus]
MFSKAFRVKSNTAVKGSDRRKLRADVAVAFPAFGPEQLSELVPGKDELNIVKLYAHKGDAVAVYVSGGNPVLFELKGTLYPTVYTLWSYPNLLPVFTTWPPVLEKLVGGADLMLPGLMVPPGGLPQVQQGDLCAVTLVGSRAPVAIGVATMSTAEMLASGLKGRGFTVLHTYLDHLWQFGDKSSPPTIPLLDQDPPECRGNAKEEGPVQVDSVLQGDMDRLTLQGDEESSVAHKTHPSEATEELREAGMDQEPADSKTFQEQMDELLLRCFFHALKCRVTKADLPLLTSTFLGSHMFSCCPEGQQLDIKKSSYKKLSKFLHHMMKEQIVQVKELSKGVESIVAVDWKHPSITSFVVPEPSPTAQSVQEDTKEKPYHPPEIESLYCIPANMISLFQVSGHKKGSTLSGSEVRAIIIDYAKKNNLVDADNKNLVKMDPILCDCILEKAEQNTISRLPWDKLIERCLQRLKPAYQVTFYGQEPTVKKGKICPIDITLAQRACNKKVRHFALLSPPTSTAPALAPLLSRGVPRLRIATRPGSEPTATESSSPKAAKACPEFS